MESEEAPFCTDEELLQELKNLGYHDVSADAFLMMKKDLSKLVLQDETISCTSIKKQSSIRDKNYPAQSQKSTSSHSFLNGKSPTFIVESKAPFDYTYHPSELDAKISKYRQTKNYVERAPNDKESTKSSDTSLEVDSSPDASLTNVTSFSQYKEKFANFKAAQEMKAKNGGESSVNSSSVSLEGNRIKRKILRHKNGKPVVTEEYLEIPIIFNTSYPETENTDVSTTTISSDETSFKSDNSSEGASATNSSSETPRSTVSTRSVLSQRRNPRKKKSDPVALYNFYKQCWKDFKPPGEKTHDKLRWAIRDRMLDYS